MGYFESDDDTVDNAEDLTAKEMWTNFEHRGNVVELGGSSIPLSTNFAERVLPLISNQMGLVPSRFRNDDQQQTTFTVANENEFSTNGSTNDPTHISAGSIGTESSKVSTNENRVEIPRSPTAKFTVLP